MIKSVRLLKSQINHKSKYSSFKYFIIIWKFCTKNRSYQLLLEIIFVVDLPINER